MTRRLGKAYAALDHPILYWLVTHLLAPGADQSITNRIRRRLERLPRAERLLDVGCGPKSWLFRVGLSPVGLDLCEPYVKAYASHGAPAVLGSATELPFCDGAFDGVWSIALLHHLPHPVAADAVGELVRVCRPGGYVAVVDAVYPRSRRARPIPHFILSHDRGQFMRTQGQLESLLPDREHWSIERWTYSLTGLEMLMCARIKQTPSFSE